MERTLLDSITVRPGRRRLSPDTVQSLAASISEIGLLNAITITSDGVLVAGLHRLEAVRSLGWRDVPATVITVDEATRELAEIDENLCRSDLTELERGELEKRRTELRIAAHPETKHGGAPGAKGLRRGKAQPIKDDKMSSLIEAKKSAAEARAAQRRRRRAERITPDVKDEIADMLEIADSGVELDALASMEPAQQRAAVAAVKAGTARDVRHAATKADRAAKVDAAVAALPAGRYRVIYADPPWQYGDTREGLSDVAKTAAASQYPTMPTADICALAVPEIAAADAVLFCWATFPMLPDALRVVAAWGFTYKTAIVWAKGRPNFGHYHDASAELLLIATRGSCVPDVRESRVAQVQQHARGSHSAKPEAFRDLISAMYPKGPRVELFRRGTAPTGWVVWGDEVTS